ncbi:MAG: DUF4832 domain-containing protein [Acetatifactor sp.]|nr:DUF4832 domain-containing protein [Acetatifactor sp.]
MKKTFGMLLAAAVVISTLGGCGQSEKVASGNVSIEETVQPAAASFENEDSSNEQSKEEKQTEKKDKKDSKEESKKEKAQEKEEKALSKKSADEDTDSESTTLVSNASRNNKKTGNSKNRANAGSNAGNQTNNGNSSNAGKGNNSGNGNGNKSTSNSGQNTSGGSSNNSGSNTSGSTPAPAPDGGSTPVTLNVTEHAIAPGNTPEVNPLKGLIPFAGETTFPHSMEWFYIAVNEVEVAEGVYDWTALENRLSTIAARGHQAVLRFYYDYPGESTGVPQYLIDEYGLQMKAYNEPDDLGGAGLCPDYSNAKFRQSMQDFIAAFGAEYDGDPRIGYITEGLLGFWGEWHNWPFDEDTSDGKPDWSIPAAVYTEVYAAFDNAFDTTQLVVREPKDGVDNASFRTGYHDDSFAYATLSAANGGQTWSFMQRLINQGVENNWRFGCIGGEVYPPIQGEIFKENPTPLSWAPTQNWQLCVDETHASWLMCDQIKGFQGTTRENAINASKGLGYDLQVTKAAFSNTIGANTGLPVSVTMKNNGVAPFYYDHNTWKVMVGVKSGSDLIKKWETDWDLSDVAPYSDSVTFDTNISDHGLGDGTYTLAIKVKNPLAGGVLFSFANEAQGTDGWLTLGTFTVSGAGVINNPPIADDNGPAAPTEPEPAEDGVNGLYEAENGVLEGKASLSENYKASGGKMVGWIGTGNGESGSLLLNHINVDEAGAYTAEIAYVLGEESRTAYIDVNGTETVEVHFTFTGGWSTLGTTLANLNLNAGVNTLRIYNNDGYSPDIDYVKLTKGYTEIPEPGNNEEPENPGTDPGNTPTPVVFTHGTLTDWSGVNSIYRNDAQTVWAKADADYVYFATEFTYANLQHWQVMIEADGNADTGMVNTWPFTPGGVDYLIEGDFNGGNLAYKASSDSDWSWDYTVYTENAVEAVVDGSDKFIEVKVKKEALTKTDRVLGDDVAFGFRYIDGDWAEIGSTNSGEFLHLYLNENTQGGSGGDSPNPGQTGSGSTFTGSLPVWNGVSVFYEDSTMQMFVTDDADYIYIGAVINNIASYPHWAVEFNSDGNTATGYQLDWVWAPGSTGSDYVVEDGGLKRHTTNTTSWASLDDINDGVVFFDQTEGVIELKIAKAKLSTSDKPLNATIGIGMELKDEWWGLAGATNGGNQQNPLASYTFTH